MRRIFALAAMLLVISQVASAIPAKRGKFVAIQPDGTRVTLEVHGDEFYHWTTLEDGTVVSPDKQGFYRKSSMPKAERLGGREQARKDNEAIRARRAAQGARPRSISTYHFPVILVAFSDVDFTVTDPQTAFSNMLNQEGYSENGAKGSVHDYYWENSMHTFDAQFDVFGPYPYDGACADNSGDKDAAKILWDAISKNDDAIDWSLYDNDGDGVVDMVFLYYAGYNSAEGNANTIWPHKYDFQHAGVTTTTLDGKSFGIYACTSELKGTPLYGSGMCGIGTAAHEFAHTQGLPDFYDVNYANYSGDTECGASYDYDVMCSGGYNDEGRMPPYFTGEERIMMGWMSGYETVPASGEVTLNSLSGNVAYRMDTNTEGEYFVLESRPGTGWDASLEPGLLVYHVDKNPDRTIKYYYDNNAFLELPTSLAWSYSMINVDGTHPCYYIIPAADPTNLNYLYGSKDLPFPGAQGVVEYTPRDWDGNSYGPLTGIAFHSGNGTVTFSRMETFRGLSVTVKSTAGALLSDATVSLYSSGLAPENLIASAVTDDAGRATFHLEDYAGETVTVGVTKAGYIGRSDVVTLSTGLESASYTLRAYSEPLDFTLKKYDPSAGIMYMPMAPDDAISPMYAVGFTAAELADYVGRKVLSVRFMYYSTTATAVHGLAEFGTTRVFTRALSAPASGAWNTVDVSDLDVRIPSGQDIKVGYALENVTDNYGMMFEMSSSTPGAGYIAPDFTTDTAGTWTDLSGMNLIIALELDGTTLVKYTSIANPSYGAYKVGDTLSLSLVAGAGDEAPSGAVSWLLNDEPVTGDSVTFKYPGLHVIEARFNALDGKPRIAELEVTVTP